MTIKRNQILITVEQIKKNFYSITRQSQAVEVLTIYAKRKDIDNKIILLLNNLKEVKKALSL